MATAIPALGYEGVDFIDLMLRFIVSAFQFLIVFLIGYFIALFTSAVIKRFLNMGGLKTSLVRYGAMTTKLWESITSFLGSYLKWYITLGVLTVFDVAVIHESFVFLTSLLWFIILSIIGLGLGGIIYKIIKDMLHSLGVEEELKKHKISGAFGGFTLSGILAGIVKWYIVLLFIGQGIAQLNLSKLSQFVDDLMVYIPNAILGLLIIIVALLVSNLSAVKIRHRKTSISEILALGVQLVVVFFGAVIALPKFGVANISILEDTFKIFAVGISLGIGIALGLGLKEPITKLGEKYGRQL